MNFKNLGNGAIEFDTKGFDPFGGGNEENDDDFDDLEKQLEMDADAMLQSWDRELLMKEIRQERDLIMRNKDKAAKEMDYYDGKTKFSDMIKDMRALPGNQVYIKITESIPQGQQIRASDTILFDRIGHLEGHPLPFECSIYDGKPTKVSLVEGPILPGLLLALLEMREGERADVIVKPGMGFGVLGCPPTVPGDTTLFYNLKVYKVWAESLLESVIQMEHDQLVDFPLDKKMSLIMDHKDAANKFLHDGYPRDALIRYKSAIKYLDELSHDKIEQLGEGVKELYVTLLVNASITMNKLEMPKSATKMAKRALFLAPKNLKAYYQLIKARIMLMQYEEAFTWLDKAMKLTTPNDNLFDQLKLELDSKITSGESQRRELYRRMAKGFCQSSAT